MPTETRQISFSDAELIRTLGYYCHVSGQSFPGNAKSLELITRDGDVCVEVRDAENNVLRHFYSTEVAAAILLMCKRAGIPVARRAEKKIKRDKGQIVFDLTIKGVAPLPEDTVYDPYTGAKTTPRPKIT